MQNVSIVYSALAISLAEDTGTLTSRQAPAGMLMVSLAETQAELDDLIANSARGE